MNKKAFKLNNTDFFLVIFEIRPGYFSVRAILKHKVSCQNGHMAQKRKNHAHTMSYYLWNHANRHKIWSKCMRNKTRPRVKFTCMCAQEKDAYHWPTELTQRNKPYVCMKQTLTHAHKMTSERVWEQSVPNLSPLCKQGKWFTSSRN